MITKIFPIYPDSEKDIAYYIRYITDPCKTLGAYGAQEAAAFFFDGDAAADFVWGTADIGSAVDEMRYICGYRCTIDSFELICRSLESSYLHYHRRKSDRGPVAYHIIFSWPANAVVTDHEVFHIGCKFLQELGPYPAVLGAHIEPCWDKQKQRLSGTQKHCHMLVCAYPEDFGAPIAPAKLNLGRYGIKAREISDGLAIDHAQGIIVAADTKRNRTYNLAIDDTAYVNQLIALCEDASRQVQSWSEYREVLLSKGCIVERRGPVWVYTISTPDGDKHIPERSLGVALSEETLRKQWNPQCAHKLDRFISVTYGNGKTAFVKIPLGGYQHKAQQYYLFPLDTATRYGNDVLRSYFLDHQTYTIVDNQEQFLCSASGSAILDYLGVNSFENTEAFFSSADYQRSCTKQELCARIDRQIARITYQIDHNCERHTEDFFLRNIYDYDRWLRKGCPQSPPPEKQAVPWDWSREPFFVRVVSFLLGISVPHLDLSTRVPEETVIYGGRDYEIQATLDASAIWAQERDYWLTIEDAAHNAERRYEISAAELAEVELALKDSAEVFSAAEDCRKARTFLKARLRELGSVDAVKEQHPQEFAAYEAAVVKAKKLAIKSWKEAMSLCAQHKHLQSLQPILLGTAAAEFERMKKLQFAEERFRLERIRTELEPYRPPLSSTMEDASIRAARGSAKRKKQKVLSKAGNFPYEMVSDR